MGEGSGELAVEGDVVTEKEFGRAGAGVSAAEGEEDLHGFATEAGVLQSDVAVEGDLLGSPDAHLAPAGGGHGLDEQKLGLGGWLVFGVELGEERAEAVFVFAVEDYGFGEESVTVGVAGGVFLAFRGGGASGAGSVGSGGLELFFGGHILVLCEEGSAGWSGSMGSGSGKGLKRGEIKVGDGL